jgi:hypothetical protein
MSKSNDGIVEPKTAIAEHTSDDVARMAERLILNMGPGVPDDVEAAALMLNQISEALSREDVEEAKRKSKRGRAAFMRALPMIVMMILGIGFGVSITLPVCLDDEDKIEYGPSMRGIETTNPDPYKHTRDVIPPEEIVRPFGLCSVSLAAQLGAEINDIGNRLDEVEGDINELKHEVAVQAEVDKQLIAKEAP